MDYKLYAGVCLVEENKVLLTRQSSEADQPNKWGLPAGGVEEGETLSEAAIRETREEIGIDVTLTSFVQAIILRRPKREDTLVIIYKGKIKDGQKIKPDGKEVVGYSWTSKDDIEKDKVEWRHPFFKKFVLKSFERKTNQLDAIEIVRYKV
mgnify:CR=1 FL=1